jgi:hypothetical protein
MIGHIRTKDESEFYRNRIDEIAFTEGLVIRNRTERRKYEKKLRRELKVMGML